MLKRTVMLAVAALVALAVTAPGASANWYKHHSVIQADQTIQLTGQWKYNSLVVGSIECQTQMKVKLLTNQTTAQIEEFAADAGKTPTERCVTGGPLSPCDVTTLNTTASTGNPWVAHLLQNKDTIEITSGTIQTQLEGADATTQKTHTACNVLQTLQLKPGKVHATIAGGETCTMSNLTLSGQLETQTGAKMNFTGTESVIPGATYGTLCP